MKDREWEKVMAKIDAQIGAEPDELPTPEQLRPPERAPVVPGARGPAERPSRGSAVGAFLRLGLAGALAIGMLFWPFDARCGVGLALYLAATGVLVFAGGWSALWTWRHRTPRAHVIALVIVLWGIVLGASEILPRIGYGPATLDRPRIWTCG
jgi:hypothetical protein